MSTLPTLDVQAFLNEQRLSKYQWLIFALCFCILLLDGFDTAAIGYIAPSLIKEWGVARPALAPVLSAALLGLAAGALSAGPLADRFGRKRVLVVSVLLFGVASLLSAHSPNLEYLTALRFLTGIGLGAAMPNAVTMVSEYSPAKRRAIITNAMSCGFALGAALGGFVAAWMIPQWGWRSVLELGGTAPLILAVLMAFLLPESVRYLVAKGQSNERIHAVLSRISRSTLQPAVFVSGEHLNGAKAQSGAAIVLSRRYVVGSVMMWLADFGTVSARRRRRDFLWLADGPLQREQGDRDRLRTHGNLGRGYWPGRRLRWTARSGRVHRRHSHEHGAVLDARVGSCLLSDAGSRDRRCVDARNCPVRQDRRVVSGCRNVATAPRARFHLRGDRDPRACRVCRRVDQERSQPKSRRRLRQRFRQSTCPLNFR
jgi:uncharacterized membrane protein YoaK (UPF0700 family)